MAEELKGVEEVDRLIIPTNEILFGVLNDGTIVNNMAKLDKHDPLFGHLQTFKSIANWIRSIATDEELSLYAMGKMLASHETSTALKERIAVLEKKIH